MSFFRILIFILFFVSLDQATKFMVSTNLSYGESISLLPFLDLTLIHNTGIAFSFLSEEGPGLRWLLVSLIFSITWFINAYSIFLPIILQLIKKVSISAALESSK